MNEQHRPIRSFVLRQGRLTAAQARALQDLFPRFGLQYTGTLLDLDAAFGRSAPKIAEIGFGMGESTVTIARNNPDKDYLGLEVHSPGVGSLLNLMQQQEVSNIRVIQHDAVEVFRQMLPESSLDGVHIFFPDPWHKKRHHKRRLIQDDFVQLLVSRLKPGGYLHVATDWEDYAQHVLSVLNANPLLQNTAQDFASRPDYRPLTKFEQRGIRLGHGVWDLIFRKTDG